MKAQRTKTIFFNIGICLSISLILLHINAYAQTDDVGIISDNQPTIDDDYDIAPAVPELVIIPRKQIQDSIDILLKDTEDILQDAQMLKEMFASDNPSDNLNINGALISPPVKLARINILNKLTAQLEQMIIETGRITIHSTLNIKLHNCIATQEFGRKDVKALLEVTEKAPEDFVNLSLVGKELEEGKKIFFGWMLKSSPAVSSLEHPVYDITIQDCGA